MAEDQPKTSPTIKAFQDRQLYRSHSGPLTNTSLPTTRKTSMKSPKMILKKVKKKTRSHMVDISPFIQTIVAKMVLKKVIQLPIRTIITL